MIEIQRPKQFDRREAGLEIFSDVFGRLPLGPPADDIVDFDAILTSQAGNKGGFKDNEFPVGRWPELCDYAGVLLVQLRSKQLEKAEKYGVLQAVVENADPEAQCHPYLKRLTDSLQGSLLGVLNHAPRTKEHASTGKNGREFHVGITTYGDEIYSPLAYLRGLKSRGLLAEVLRLPNESGLWTPGEQFRSSSVAELRVQPCIVQPASLADIPDLNLDGRLAYADVFGNVRIEVADIAAVKAILSSQEHAVLQVGDRASRLEVRVVQGLTEIREGELGIYYNPADPYVNEGPAYIELARRVSKPNGHPEHAYRGILEQVTDQPESFNPDHWSEINIQLTAK